MMRVSRLTSVCRVHRAWPRNTKIGTEVAHVARDSIGHHFQGQKVKGQLTGMGHIVATSLTAY